MCYSYAVFLKFIISCRFIFYLYLTLAKFEKTNGPSVCISPVVHSKSDMSKFSAKWSLLFAWSCQDAACLGRSNAKEPVPKQYNKQNRRGYVSVGIEKRFLVSYEWFNTVCIMFANLLTSALDIRFWIVLPKVHTLVQDSLATYIVGNILLGGHVQHW